MSVSTFQTREVILALKRLGFIKVAKTTGDHIYLYRKAVSSSGKKVTVKTQVDTGEKDVNPFDLNQILRQTHLSREQLESAVSRNFSSNDYNKHLKKLPGKDFLPPFMRR